MRCKTCAADKPEGDFYVSRKLHCKDCVKERVNKHRQENLERVRAYDRMRGSQPHRVAARLQYQQTRAFSQSHAAAAKRWAAKHPEREAAHIKFRNAVRDGKVKPWPCEVCGTDRVEGHHPDYSRPLQVVWLCNQHHREAHEMTKEAA